MTRESVVALLFFLAFALNLVHAGQEEYLTPPERIKYSDAVFDGTVEKVSQVGVIDENQTLWEATVLLTSIIKGKSLKEGMRVSVYYTGANGQRMIVCPSPPRIEEQLKARFYAKRHDILEHKGVLYIQSEQWLARKDAI